MDNDGAKRKDSAARISGGDRRGRQYERRLGLFILEVVRATHEGRLPVNQKEVRQALKSRYRIKLSAKQSTEITKILRQEFKHRIWLRINKQEVELFSEDTTLADSRAIKALFIARKLMIDDGTFSVQEWKAQCDSQLSVPANVSENFLTEYVACGYADPPDKLGFAPLHFRAIGEDSFYLKPASNARLTKSQHRR